MWTLICLTCAIDMWVTRSGCGASMTQMSVIPNGGFPPPLPYPHWQCRCSRSPSATAHGALPPASGAPSPAGSALTLISGSGLMTTSSSWHTAARPSSRDGLRAAACLASDEQWPQWFSSCDLIFLEWFWFIVVEFMILWSSFFRFRAYFLAQMDRIWSPVRAYGTGVTRSLRTDEPKIWEGRIAHRRVKEIIRTVENYVTKGKLRFF